ncbi:hypothetical protein FIBSPDRAFT_856828 [Athelia psychrophila]|uniref:BZIP domain-containing protein n=1 Tax=Athelia psychrophila TaxID=1759441 RepID=A0A166N4C8_9AGAM|nr:hypothetical protein FIBSPDRAFT_856828 [Fibularhizoctonia sp. CBS 109695]
MAGSKASTTRDRSESNDFEDSDEESHLDGSNGPGKPGRKKNPNSQAARRDQNRIAQREFRLRKQQRIRDLEARVELLSGGKDEVLGEMRKILKDLMEENQTLRNLLRGVSGFVGEGAGGLLPKLGWDMADFTNFINRSETDTAWESFQLRKKATASGGSSGQKRASEDDGNPQAKKPRGPSEKDDHYSMLMPPTQTAPVPVNALYPSSSSARTNNHENNGGIFSDLMRGPAGSPMFLPSPVPSSSSPYMGQSSSSSANNGFSSSNFPGLPSMNLALEGSMAAPSSYPSSVTASSSTSSKRPEPSTDDSEDDPDPKKNEALKLIHYHLENYKRNSAYCLPNSLRPTLVQRTVPHESVIDRILHPELRDRMILLRGRFELVDCLYDYRKSVTIHGDDVLAHSNWEISENWLRQYGVLIDLPILNNSNRWRRERGESELRLSDLAPAEQGTSM